METPPDSHSLLPRPGQLIRPQNIDLCVATRGTGSDARPAEIDQPCVLPQCTFINCAKVNIFVHRHPGSRSNRLNQMGYFHFRDVEMTSSRSPKVKF